MRSVFRDAFANRGRVWHVSSPLRHGENYQAVGLCGTRLTSHAEFDEWPGGKRQKMCARCKRIVEAEVRPEAKPPTVSIGTFPITPVTPDDPRVQPRKPMTVGDLVDMLDALHAACDDIEPPLSDEEWRALEIVVRGQDDDGNDFCGYLRDVGVEEDHSGEGCFLAIDASNEPADASEVSP